MPTAGGEADKLGNRYEALWAMDSLLSMVDGRAKDFILEPIDENEARGIEFSLTMDDGTVEHWSIKRQTTRAAGWTLNLLTEMDENRRSILADLSGHINRDERNRVVFASTLGTPALDELRLYAQTKEVLDTRLAHSTELRNNFKRYLLPLFDNDQERTRTFLLRSRTNTMDEHQLRGRVGFAIRKLFYSTDGSELDVDAVRGYLAEFLVEHMHQKIDRSILVDALAGHSIGVQDWSSQSSIWERIATVCRTYLAPLQEDRINGVTIRLEGSEILDSLPSQTHKILVVGSAGGGKSTTLAALVDRLLSSQTPVIPIRFDQLPDGILTTRELGKKLLLPESPSLVLAGLAAGRQGVLVIDQLDAVSFVSGRRTESWALFESLHEEIKRYKNLSIVVGCREFDLEHDRRMRRLTAPESRFQVARLKGLSAEEINNALSFAETDPGSVQATLKPILSTPLHLALFLRLAPNNRTGVQNRDELFDYYWTESEQKLHRRLGIGAAWTQVIDRLTNWLSENQELSAPRYVLDEYPTEAGALASQHFLILVDNRYRFFHESLFDYAFARRFAARGERLVSLLTTSEQHLFRRSQVRQVLSLYRSMGDDRYLEELGAVLEDARVRFHIKRALLQWLSSAAEPIPREWAVIQSAISRCPELGGHAMSAISNRIGWFDVMDSAGFFDAALSSQEEHRQQQAIWLLSLPAILEQRSSRVADLVKKYRRTDERWNKFVMFICGTGSVFHDRKLFEIYLREVDEGAFDRENQPGRGFWATLYSMSEKRPDYAAEAIAHWFDRQVAVWRQDKVAGAKGEESGDRWRRLKTLLQGVGHPVHVFRSTSNAFVEYGQLLLPRIAQLIRETAKEVPGHLKNDPLWSFRIFGDSHGDVSQDIFEYLARSLEEEARTSPQQVDKLLEPYRQDDSDSIAFLVLRAWTAAPQFFADRTVNYLIADARRLQIGYATGGGTMFVSAEAVRAASRYCSADLTIELEKAILSFRDGWGERYPRARGRKQLELLMAFDFPRLSETGARRFRELQRKFPDAQPEPPVGLRGGFVPSPISTDAMDKMSDAQWVRAMRKYNGVDHKIDSDGDLLGGEQQIATYVQNYATKQPERFIAIVDLMPDNLSTRYFEMVAYGVAAALTVDGSAVSAGQAASLVRRLYGLPDHPCGRAISCLFQKASQLNWPEDTVDLLAWYATKEHDPAPDESDLAPPSVASSTRPDLYGRGINSVRGGAAEAVGQLLFSQRELYPRLQSAVRALAIDPSTAVRSCSILPLVATLNIDSEAAIVLFQRCVAERPALLGTPHVRQFIRFAAPKDFRAMRPFLDAMLTADTPGLAFSAAQELCLLSFDIDAAAQRLAATSDGTVEVRKGIANVYAANVSNAIVGKKCRIELKRFFNDPDSSVQLQAAAAFEHTEELETGAQSELLEAFLASKSGLLPLVRVSHALVNSPVQLPDLVCTLAEMCLGVCREDSSSSAAISMDLSKLVVRLYAHTDDAAVRSRCLSIIDEMERNSFVGLATELESLDR